MKHTRCSQSSDVSEGLIDYGEADESEDMNGGYILSNKEKGRGKKGDAR
jgi:hypothetical protein